MDTALIDALRAGLAGEGMQNRAADTIERLQRELEHEQKKVRVLRKAVGFSISKGALA